MTKPVIALPEDQPLTLANLSPSQSQRRLALAFVIIFLAVLFISVGQLSNVQLRRVDAFVPAYGTAVFVNDVITAVLLFNQFAILRSPALPVISNGYFFTALTVIPGLLSFPGGIFVRRPTRRWATELELALHRAVRLFSDIYHRI